MDFMGLFWVALLLGNQVSTVSNWPTGIANRSLAETDQTSILAQFDVEASPPSGRFYPLASASGLFPRLSIHWQMWATSSAVSVAQVSTSPQHHTSLEACWPRTSELSEGTRHQIWVYDTLVSEVADLSLAQHIALRLRQFISQADKRLLLDIQPSVGPDYAAVNVQDEILFVIDDRFNAKRPDMAAVHWANRLRLAFKIPPLELATVQMLALGFTEGSQRFSGKASWYGPYFHGRLTATGEVFNQHHLTAAHPSLPFGTYLKVRNRLNQKTVVVRVNDRGPYISGRSLDLSYAAAQCLGSKEVGVIPYEATILKSGKPSQWLARSDFSQ